MTQHNLGNVYLDQPGGDWDANLRRAIDCYKAALRVRTETMFPQDWAMTQHSLGVLFIRKGYLRQALSCFENALRVLTKETFPHFHSRVIVARDTIEQILGETVDERSR